MTKQLKKRDRILRLLGLLIIFALLFLWDQSATKTAKQTLSNEAQIALGKTVYEENCARCHGPDGAGHAEVDQAPALNGSEHSWHHTDGLLQDMVSDGSEIMPTFGETLSNEEIIAVIRHFQTWWPEGKFSGQQNASKSNPFQDK